MSPLLIALLGALLVPLLVVSWRVNLFGLACQGLLMAAVAYRLHPHLSAPDDWLVIGELALVRGLGVPIALHTVVRARAKQERQAVTPPNLLSWTLAFAIVLVSFSFAETMVSVEGEQRTCVAVATSGLLLGFLVLAMQRDPLSQVVGALRIENAVALVELGSRGPGLDFGLKLGLLGVFVATVALFCAHLLRAKGVSETNAGLPEEPTL